MKTLLAVASFVEAVTGLALLAYPPIVIQLLFGAEIAGAGVLASRVAGITLIALGVACWPAGVVKQGVYGMLTYNLLVTLYFIYLGLGGAWVGMLLWPAAAFHAVLTILLARAWLRDRKLIFKERVQ
jgi:hypothetical protein